MTWSELLLLVMLMLLSSVLLLLLLMLLLLLVRAVSTAGDALSQRPAICIGILIWIDDTDSSQFDRILDSQIVLYH